MNTSVHLAGSLGGPRRPRQATTADQARSVPWIRVRPGAPRTVRTAVGLMYAAAALELAALITLVVTAGSVRSAVLRSHPAQWHTALVYLTVDEITAPIVVVLLLWLAWANGRGYHWARPAFAAFLGVLTVVVFFGPVEGGGDDALPYTWADEIATTVLWLAGVAAALLIFSETASPYYQQEPARQELAD